VKNCSAWLRENLFAMAECTLLQFRCAPRL
jgi:hypothetical protein